MVEDIPAVESEREQLELRELAALEKSVVEMALSKIEGVDGLYVGGIWALRRSDSLLERGLTHVLSLVSFDPAGLKNFKDEPFSEYGKPFKHLLIDIDDVEDADLLVELPRAVRFIDEGLKDAAEKGEGGVFVHCAAGKSRSVSVVVAYLLWRYPSRFDPNTTPTPTTTTAAAAAPSDDSKTPTTASRNRSRRDTAIEAVNAAVALIRRTRPMAEPNEGFAAQLALWWEMGCPHDDVESQPAYQRWAYQREVQENLAVGQAPTRLRFEDEVAQPADSSSSSPSGVSLRCKKCRRTLATSAFILQHEQPASSSSSTTATSKASACQHVFIEPLSWMRAQLEKGELSGRLACPTARCGAGVGRYDWKGFRCSCGAWLTPAFSLQRARVDEEVPRPGMARAEGGGGLGIRMPPGARGAGGNL